MKCNNDLCIHNFGKVCELQEISMDWRGNCENMQNIYFPQKTIRSHKLYTQVFLDCKIKFNPSTGKYTHLQTSNTEKEQDK